MKQTIAFGAAARQGNWPVQEDGFFADPQQKIFALADGFGGRGNGDIAVKTALAAFRAKTAKEAPAPAEIFESINKAILDWSNPRPPASRGGCSMAFLRLESSGMISAANCGATGVGLIRGGRCLSILSPQSAPRPVPGMPLLPDEALGLLPGIKPEVRSFRPLPGDLIFLSSSGLEWEGEPFQTEILAQWSIHMPGSSIAPLAESLVQAAYPDWNATFLGIEINGV